MLLQMDHGNRQARCAHTLHAKTEWPSCLPPSLAAQRLLPRSSHLFYHTLDQAVGCLQVLGVAALQEPGQELSGHRWDSSEQQPRGTVHTSHTRDTCCRNAPVILEICQLLPRNLIYTAACIHWLFRIRNSGSAELL